MFGLRFHSIESAVIRAVRLLAIIVLWCAVVALAMRYFFSPMGAVEDPGFHELIGFACAFTITGAVAASIALLLAGKWRWAVQVAIAFVLTAGAVAGVAYVLLWGGPWTLRNRMDAWSFLRLQMDVEHAGKAMAGFYGPMAVGVGAVVGAITGGLIALARRRPRLARWICLGVLVACASGPVRPVLFDAVVFWGMIVRWLLFENWTVGEHVWATAAIFGAFAGALDAYLWTRAARGRRTGVSRSLV